MRNGMRTASTVLSLWAAALLSGCTVSSGDSSQADAYRGEARADVLTPAEPIQQVQPEPAPPVVVPEPVVVPPPAPEPVAPVQPVTYTIKQGDSLWQIAKTHYGDGQKWKAIVDANPGLNPDRLQVGKSIVLP